MDLSTRIPMSNLSTSSNANLQREGLPCTIKETVKAAFQKTRWYKSWGTPDAGKKEGSTSPRRLIITELLHTRNLMPAICSLLSCSAMMWILPGNVSHVSHVTCDVDTCLANYNCRMPSSASGSLLQRKDLVVMGTLHWDTLHWRIKERYGQCRILGRCINTEDWGENVTHPHPGQSFTKV